jgi:hypothetical protein
MVTLGIRSLLLAICILVSVNTVAADISSLSKAEIEQRNAAAAFVFSRDSTTVIVIGECSNLLSDASPSVESVVRGWYDRNKSELEATYVWTDQYLLYLKSTNPTLYQSASIDLVKGLTKSGLEITRTMFKRQLPDRKSCEVALSQYASPQFDIKNIAQNQGFESFGEFAQTLSRIHAEPDFTVPSNLHWGYENVARFRPGLSDLASLDASEAAKERGDGAARIAALKSMAQRGDGTSAQSIGIMFLNGNLVKGDYTEAYRWFYAAWSLSEYEGLNAMGVMFRDGLGVTRNLPLAQASFIVATGATRNRETHDRALANSKKLESQINAEGSAQIACFSLQSLDDELRKPIQSLPQLVKGKPLSGAERRLGSLIPGLVHDFHADSCI